MREEKKTQFPLYKGKNSVLLPLKLSRVVYTGKVPSPVCNCIVVMVIFTIVSDFNEWHLVYHRDVAMCSSQRKNRGVKMR